MHTQEYTDYIGSPEWLAKRAQRLAVDDHTCQFPGLHGGPNQVHHLTYDRLGHENMADLVTACDAHHKMVHAEQRRTGEPLDMVTRRMMNRPVIPNRPLNWVGWIFFIFCLLMAAGIVIGIAVAVIHAGSVTNLPPGVCGPPTCRP